MNKGHRPFRWMAISVVKEPLVQFLAIGALIFGGFALFERDGAAERPTIVADEKVVARLAALYEKQMGARPDERQLEALVDTYIREQVLYLEARRLRLDESDEIIRRRLVQKMEFLATREAPSPTEADLRRYYDEHRDEFLRPARVSFTHVYFSPDRGGANAAAVRAMQALGRLQPVSMTSARGPQHPGEGGDPFPLQASYSKLTRPDAVQLFGNTPIIDALYSAPEGAWSGPHASGYGWHLVRIEERTPEAVPPFEQVAEEVRTAHGRTNAEQQTQAAIDEMASRYDIVRAGGGARVKR